MRHFVFRTLGQARRLIIIVAGFTILAAGVAMIVLPGPAVVVIPVGLSILASEFIWARKLLDKVKERILRMRKTKPMPAKPASPLNQVRTETTQGRRRHDPE
jgi:tellurite resistance protein TerC